MAETVSPSTAEHGAVDPNRWFRTIKPVVRPRLRLVCFPHAGGSAGFFRTWAEHVPHDVELVAVRYPGREDRLHDRPARSMAGLAASVAVAVASLGDGISCAFFGHSMGSLVAFETALRLENAYDAAHAMPCILFVSGSSGPGSPARGAGVRSDAADQELVDDLLRLGGVEPAVLAFEELRDLILPAVRADYRIIEQYRPAPSLTVNVPIVAYYGLQDEGLGPEPSAEWERVTSCGVSSRAFEGGHFYLTDHLPALISDVFARLERGMAS